MGSREQLHESLVELLGSRHVYFQPPESVRIEYPCIIYQRSTGDTTYADDLPYMFTKRYQLTYISKDPDDGMVDKIAKAYPYIRMDRHFTSENLNHDVFDLYY